MSVALKYPKSLWSYNPSPTGCVLYLPLWHPSLSGPVFKSVDPFGHICTVTNALYKGDKLGRLFDAVDDVINCGSGTSIDNIWDGGGTVIAWIRVASDGEGNGGRIFEKGQWILAVASEAVPKVKIGITVVFDGDNGGWATTATEVTLDTFTMVSMTYDSDSVANNPIIYINKTAKTVGDGLTETGTPTNTRTSDAASTLYLGDNAASSRCLDGYEGEAAFYAQILPASDIAHYYNKTKFRYT